MSVVVQVAHSVNGVESSCMKLSVINFIIMHRNSIGLVLCLCLILTGVISIIYDRISKNKFITLCSLFVEKIWRKTSRGFNLSGWGVLFLVYA